MKQQPTCEVPFERGERLCKVCRLATDARQPRGCARIVAQSPAMQAVMLRAAIIAASDAPVVILGESGAGKEVLARVLHVNSPRRDEPFHVVHLPSMPAAEMEAALFTGGACSAVPNGQGTLLLDEVSDLPPSAQAKLAALLGDPRGPSRTRRPDAAAPVARMRVVCSTRRDLGALVVAGQFREDLYYRLRVFALAVPPLRARREDIYPLACSVLETERHPTRRFTSRARAALEAHGWPGNVRELRNAVVHGAVLSGGGDVDLDHLPDEVARGGHAPRPSGEWPLRPLADVERDHVLGVVEACGGRQQDAARILGIGRTTLWRKLRAMGASVTP